MKRTLLALGVAGTLALTGCGITSTATRAPAPAAAADSSGLSDEAVALQQVGFDTGLAEAPSPSATASASPDGKSAHRKALRKYLRRDTLHGEVTLQTKKQGVRTLVVQRGSVTAVTATGVTVKSSDGFTLTWTYGDQLKVVQDKKKADKSAVKTGAEIGIAGVKDGSATDARLIAVK
jgi:hypothetical protein